MRSTAVPPKNSSKNFGTVGITRHTDAVWMPVWTTCVKPSNCPPLRTQHGRCPQRAAPHRGTVHNPLTTRHNRHAGPTSVYPQSPHALILLLVYLLSFSFEEATWGHIDSPVAEALCAPRCHPDRLAFKLSRKALRWFIDSRYGRRYASARRVVRHRENAG